MSSRVASPHRLASSSVCSCPSVLPHKQVCPISSPRNEGPSSRNTIFNSFDPRKSIIQEGYVPWFFVLAELQHSHLAISRDYVDSDAITSPSRRLAE
ncbi:hypothetical protein BaRGS_00014014 [Batillaria attramentaria]|uniref:Uncharacterized protein n=1 Tax=Batillaria attramentaria TaxID=370345 RepID=A0ABD0L5S9_9CAEN